ncbi:hypothetical protein AB6A23_13505 [Paenibacillus tarimensis]
MSVSLILSDKYGRARQPSQRRRNENVLFENNDVPEHHEPQPDYWGCMSINAGDNNTVRIATYRNIRVVRP